MTQTLEDVQQLTVNKWGTLNTAASPERLPEGHSPNNQNVWMDEKPGSVVTANGYIKLGTNPSGNPTTLLIDYYKTSDGSQTVILSDGSTVWKTTDYSNFTEIKTGLSSFFQLRGAVIRGKLWLTNGSDPVMTYDGTTLTVLDGTAGTPDVPIGKYIAYHDERVWIYGISGDPSSLVFSDLADSSGTEIEPDNANAWPVDNEIQVSEGDDDIGTGLFIYRGYLYASKSFSIWRIVGYDEYTYQRVKTRSSTGTRFQESVKEVDNLVHLIGVDGLYVFDGEESKRISDIVDPSSSEEGVFSFRNLQQPLVNNQFWNVSETADFAAGTVPANISSAGDKLTLLPADTSQADFEAGATLTNIDTEIVPGAIRLSRKTTGTDSANTDLAAHQEVAGSLPGGGSALIGSYSSFTDQNDSSFCGITVTGTTIRSISADINLLERTYVNNVEIDLLNCNVSTQVTFALYLDGDVNPVGNDIQTIPPSGSRTVSFHFTPILADRIIVTFILPTGYCYAASIIVRSSVYNATGEFTSKTLDYGAAPSSYGNLSAATGPFVTQGTTHCNVSFYTQSSSDGSTWDAAVVVANGGLIGSTPKRYLRWGALFTSDGADSFGLNEVYVGGTYLSSVHDTGGNIFQWGAFQLDHNKLGQTVDASFRAATTLVGVSSASWTPIVPGAIPNTAITNVFIQVKLELSTSNTAYAPYVLAHIVNWVAGSGGGVNTLQNVASFVWLNRYWLAAATIGAEANDIVLVRGKATYGSPFHKKDFSILSFARFQDYFIAGSSINGDIYRMEYGFSKAGEEMDSFYETTDFNKAGAFMYQGYEVMVGTDRSGPYTVSLGISTDGGISYTEKTVDLTRATTSQSLGFSKKLNVSFMSDKFRLRVRNNAADQPFSVDSLDVFYRLLPARGGLD